LVSASVDAVASADAKDVPHDLRADANAPIGTDRQRDETADVVEGNEGEAHGYLQLASQ
jgi:hypothetical protein